MHISCGHTTIHVTICRQNPTPGCDGCGLWPIRGVAYEAVFLLVFHGGSSKGMVYKGKSMKNPMKMGKINEIAYENGKNPWKLIIWLVDNGKSYEHPIEMYDWIRNPYILF